MCIRDRDKSTGGAPDWMTELDAPSNNGFELEMEYLKALPKGEETDFVLVSCGGAGLEDGEDRDKLVKVRVYFYLFPYKTPLMGNWTDAVFCVQLATRQDKTLNLLEGCAPATKELALWVAKIVDQPTARLFVAGDGGMGTTADFVPGGFGIGQLISRHKAVSDKWGPE